MIKMVKIPRMLFDHDYYKNLSDRAKVLYGILWKKKQEAERYGWLDKEGSPYVIFPKKKMQEELACSRYRLDLVTNELVATDLIELVYGIGDSLERRIYVHNLSEECPWIKVMYGTVMDKDKPADRETGKDDPDEEEAALKKAATKEDVCRETGPEKDQKGSEVSEKEEADALDPGHAGLPELIGALVTLLLNTMPDGNDGPLA